MLTDSYIAEILRRVDSYREQEAVSDTTVSRRVFGEPQFVNRLRRGENVTVGKVRRLEEFLREHDAATDRGRLRLPVVTSPSL